MEKMLKKKVVSVRLSAIEEMAIEFVRDVRRAYGYELDVSDVIRYCITSEASRCQGLRPKRGKR